MTDRDDEVTTDVDPDWIAAIRDETARRPPDGSSTSAAHEQPAVAETGDAATGEDWFDTELQWDAEATVGVTSGLLDRIRAEIDSGADGRLGAPPADDASPPTPTATPAPAPAPAAPVPAVAPAPRPTAPPTAPLAPPAAPAPPPMPIGAPLSISAAEESASTTVRWEPRQRLAVTAPVKESAAIVDQSRHVGLDRTKVLIAVIVAVTIVLIVWLVSRSADGGSTPIAPGGTVPAATTVAPGDGGGADDGGGAGG